ncbi:MAG: c-type cytochrome [Acidimicrobiales bacterium]
MVEVPEHLLRRSKERRAALGLGGGDAGDATGPAADGPSGASAPTPAASAPAPAEPVAAEPEVIEVEPEPELVGAGVSAFQGSTSGVPRWMMPVLVILPLWAILYATALQPHVKSAAALSPVQLGAAVYHGKGGCAGCHGGAGEGGVGPQLAGGQAVKTFPNVASHIAWVETGSQTKPKGTAYGDPNREGGQHVVTQGVMPAFKGTLTDAEIAAVVAYERSL